MIMRFLKILWIVAAIIVLYVTIDGFHDARDKGIWEVLTWLMLILSFPTGLMVSLVLWVLEEGLSITNTTSYLSLALGWAGYFVVGYLQWFKLLPFLTKKLRALIKSPRSSD